MQDKIERLEKEIARKQQKKDMAIGKRESLMDQLKAYEVDSMHELDNKIALLAAELNEMETSIKEQIEDIEKEFYASTS